MKVLGAIHSIYDGGKKMRSEYERCADGVPSISNLLQNVSTKNFGPFIDSLEKHDYIIVRQEEIALDPDRKIEYKLLRDNDIRLFLAVPIKMNGKLMGLIGVANPTQNIASHDFLQNIGFFVYDAMQKHEINDRLLALSLKDELTGLPNRYCYDQALESMRGEASPNTGILFADLNGLKYINDHFGHRYGDEYLKKFSESLAQSFGEDNVYRISGDEFVVIEKGVDPDVFKKQEANLEEDIVIKGFEVASFGAIHSSRCSEPLRLINEAESIMYEKKKKFHANRPVMSDEEKEAYYKKRFPFLPR